ncbi:hypothetical protein HYH03_018434 [Edaphochlamys debaryana]|uniref:Uncharacterized protein n=1 Tax=Edaphochlamys debaryana TaxID=47281 RepID=A0A835XGJ8_9CHLO|nr:hypothetical protein HYH03_018434 [Edaphochlamys debaryana]|eukprot:KAG2482662.1 hypothetical protein HYH03_018434 [Edaphochlamys debaryana]
MASPAKQQQPGPGSGSGGGSLRHEEAERRHVWTAEGLQGVDDPATDLKVLVHDGRLIIKVKGQETFNDSLPPTAYTGGDAKASFQRGTLRVDMASKDPSAPAMLEKSLMDPDRPHPRELPLSLPGGGGSGIPLKQDPTGPGAPTAAQAEYGARNPDLFSGPRVDAVLPEANLGSTIASAMPTVTHQGAAVEAAADNGEAVVLDPSSSDTKVYTPHVDQLADRLGQARLAPPGTTVVQGGRDKVMEKEHGEYGTDTSAPDQHVARKIVDYTEEKVGMATRPLVAADFYATSESANEPLSSMKAQNQLTPQEQKRSGRPATHNTAKPVTGKNHHAAHDYTMHAKPRSEQHAQVELRTREYQGNVNQEGIGSFEDVPEAAQNKVIRGREINPELVADRTKTAQLAMHFLG